jgi:hypothetical protein
MNKILSHKIICVQKNLRKVTEVKTERKRVNFRDREDRIKFQAVIPDEKK